MLLLCLFCILGTLIKVIPDTCEIENHWANKMCFWQILVKIETTSFLRWVGTGTSNRQGSFPFYCSF